MRYDSTLTAFMLKKQPIGEADLLVTWYTKEEGKLRSTVVSARRSQSRLAYVLQPAAIASIRLVGRVTGGSLFKLVGATPVKSYVTDFSEAQSVLHAWFTEILMRATPDAESNAGLFAAACTFFTRLSLVTHTSFVSALAVATLSELLNLLGVAVHEELGQAPQFFSVSGGGFFRTTENIDRLPISEAVWNRYSSLKNANTINIFHDSSTAVLDEKLLSLLQVFLEYHLERPIRSFAFLSGIIKAS